MSVLILDTETTGLPKKDLPWEAPEQPRMVQYSAALFDDDGTPVSAVRNQYVDPGTALIDKGAEATHGISVRKAKRFGIKESVALANITAMKGKVSRVVMFGPAFDRNVIAGGLRRLKMKAFIEMWEQPGVEWVDVKELMTGLIGEKFDDDGLKWPSLEECCENFLKVEHVGKHQSWPDVEVTAGIFWELVKRGIIKGMER